MSQSNSGITQRSSFCHPERSEGSGHCRFFGLQPQNDNDWKKTCAYCKIAILIIYFLIVLGCFKFFLSSQAEAFFMSIPILAVLGAGIFAAAEDLRLKAIIIDSSFANVDGLALETVERIGFFPPVFVKMIARIGLDMASLECGFDLRKFSTERAIAQVKQPVLLVHGKKDTLIPWEETEKLFARAHQPKFLHFFETLGHYTTISDSGYKMIIANFISVVEQSGKTL